LESFPAPINAAIIVAAAAIRTLNLVKKSLLCSTSCLLNPQVLVFEIMIQGIAKVWREQSLIQ
jgi:hypothetical protein